MEGVGQVDAAAAGEFLGLDVLDGVTEGFLLTGDAEGGDDHFIKEFVVLHEDDVDGAAVEDHQDRLVSDTSHLEGGADRHVVEGEGTVKVGDGAVRGTLDHDAGSDDRADVVVDDTGDRAVLGRNHPRHCDEEGHQQS